MNDALFLPGLCGLNDASDCGYGREGVCKEQITPVTKGGARGLIHFDSPLTI